MIKVNEVISLTNFRKSDKSSLIEHFKEKAIYDNTLHIPYPYTETDADYWIDLKLIETKNIGFPVSFAIRTEEDKLIGGIGFDGLRPGKTHTAEIGYWLCKSFWNKGIMTECVKAVCNHGFNKLGLIRITAHIFIFNNRSEKVLKKCGFLEEGLLRKHYLKEGNYIDAKILAILKADYS